MPDTSGFKDDLKEKLRKIEHDIAVTIRTKADASGARKDVLEAVRAINRDNKSTDSRKIRFYTKLDLNGMSSEVRNAVREYQARANQHRITFNATGRQVVSEARRTRRAADAELSGLKLSVNLDNQGSVLAAIGKVKAALVALGETDIDVDLDEDSLNAAVDMFEDRLDEIGHIVLRVDRESESSVKAAVAEIDRELQKLAETELKVMLDRDSLEAAKRDLLAESRRAAQELADEIQGDLDAIRVRPELDQQKVDQVKRQLEASFEQMHNLKAQITPELDALAKRKVERDIDDLQDKIDKLKSEIEPEVSRTGILGVMTHLALLTRDRFVDIFPKVNLSAAAATAAFLKALSGGRVISDMFDSLWDSIKNLDRAAPIIGTLAAAIAGLAGWSTAAASNLATLSSSLASIGPTALLLPGLLGGMAVGLGVTVAAFRDFNKVLPEVKSALSGLQDTISENFWEKAATPIRQMVNELLPEFTAGVARTATQLGGFFGGLATSLQGALDPALNQMFADLSSSINIATTGTGAFANIIAVLGRVGTSYLPALAQWFVDLAKRFSDFLTASENDGRLKGWIDEGIQALKDLGSVLSNTGGILAGVSRAAEAAGGSTLGMLADTLERIHRTVDSEGFQRGLTDVFAAAHEAMRRIADTSGPAVENLFKTLGSLLTTILPQVGTVIGTALSAVAGALSQPAVTQGITALFDGIQAAVSALAPAMAPLGQALGAVLSLVGALLAQLGPLVAAALTPLAQAFAQLAPAVEPLVALLGQTLTGVFAALAPLVLQVVAAVKPLVEQLVAGLAPIVPVLVAAFAEMSAALAPVIALLLQILTAAILPLIPVVQQLAAEFLPQISEAFTAVMEAVQPLLAALLGLVQFLMPVLAPAIQFIAGLFLGALVDAIEGVADVFTGLKDIFVGVWDVIVGVFRTVIGFFKGTLTGDWSTFANGLRQIWTGIKTFLSGLWDTIVGAFKIFLSVGILGAGGKILKGIGEMFKAGWTAVKTISVELWASLTARWTTFLAELRATPGAALSAISRLFSQTWTDLKVAAALAWDAVKNIFRTKVGECVAFVQGLPGKVRAVFGNAQTILVGAGRQIISGLVNGIKSMFGSVKSTLSDLTNKLTDWKGPAPKDARLLYNAGQLIIRGLVKGLESQYDNVKKALQDLTAQIPKNASKGLKDRINRDRTRLLQLVTQWESAGKKLEAAKEKLDQIREEAANYRQQITDQVIGTGDVTKIEDTSFTGITAGLKNAVEQAKKFAAVLKRLKDLGLNATTFDQIASAGPEAGLAAAEAIANAGLSGVGEINALQKELEKYAGSAGSTASHYMYDAGVQAAEGLVKGLEAQQDAIEKQMLKIADAMVAAIKRALDIHSPSRLFRKLGNFVGRGFGLGVEDQGPHVERTANALAASAVSGAARQVTAAVSGGLATSNSGPAVTKVLNYYAGSGSSLSSEEELFAAASRARMVGW